MTLLIHNLSTQQITLFVILVVAFFLLVTELIRVDLTAVLPILALAGTGILRPDEALSGFGSEPAIVLAAVFVLGAALFHTGLSDRLGYWIGHMARQGLTRMLAVIMVSVAALSAFTNHVTITAIMLSVLLRLSREQDIPSSRLLMPMSLFLTPIGHHGNLLIYSPGGYKFFDFLKVGTPLSVLVAVLVAWLAPLVWPG
jgi:di/tricarboxylate transporter